jgi:hypothetical protein
MMEYAAANDVVKRPPKLGCVFDGKQTHLQIVEPVLPLQRLRDCDAACANVDPDDIGLRPSNRVMGRLYRAAPGDEDAPVIPMGRRRPHEM